MNSNSLLYNKLCLDRLKFSLFLENLEYKDKLANKKSPV